jgi:hypothetical protein
MTKKLTKSAKLMMKGLEKLKGMDFKPKDVKLGFDDELEKLAKTMKNVQKKEMGGEVMDMTKSQPVSMMDEGGQAISDADRAKVKKELQKFERSLKNQTNEGARGISDADLRRMEEMMAKQKPKKMNMGGVVPGRGGSFKGVK